MKKILLTIVGGLIATSMFAQVTHTKVGQTRYDLQSNGAVYNRIVKNADGTISVVWTYANGVASAEWPDRGTGYNYFDGTTWSNPAVTTSRLETKRTGFPAVVTTNSGAEVVVAHDGTNGTMTVNRRPVKGTGAWAQSDIPTALLWARTAVGGANRESVHMIAHDNSTSAGDVFYLKSTNAGTTWTTPGTLPGFTLNEFPGQFRGDEYAIDAKGDTVVVVFAGQTTGIHMAKSIDNGNTWVNTAVDPFPIPNYDATNGISDLDLDGIADTLNVNDGAVNVTIDQAGKIHIFWGRMRIFDDVLADNFSYFPATDGLMYWNESLTSPKMIAQMQDLNSDGDINFSELFVPDWGFGMYGSSLSSYPSATSDANNFIYVAYSGVVEASQQVPFDDDNNAGTPDVLLWMGNSATGKLNRHVYVTYSGDGGTNWTTPFDVNVNNPFFPTLTEATYPSLAKLADSDLHILYQRDTIPGYGITNTDDPNNVDMINDLVYTKVPKSVLPCNQMTINVATVRDTCSNGVGIMSLTSVMGAVAPYTYNWVGTGVSNMAASGITSGTYKVAINDSRNCKDTLEFILPNFITNISVSLTQTAQPSDCVTLDGAISSNVVGGGLPLSYSWTGVSSTNNTVSGVGIGPYVLTVTDRNNCTGVGSIILLPVTNTSSFVATVATTATTCIGTSNGSASINVTPAGSYSYTWNPSGQTATTATGFAAGNYEVYVSDGTCGDIATFTITEPATTVTATLTSTNVLCFGQTNGTLTANAAGGTPPYTFTWNATAGGSIVINNTSSTITGLANGSGYGVSVTDKYNCNVVVPTNVLIGTPAALQLTYLSSTKPTADNLNGRIRVVASGGVPPYSYTWTRTSTLTGAGSGNGPTGVTGPVFIENLTSGSHVITVTDANGCTATLTYNLTGIENNSELVKDLSVYPNPTSSEVTIDFTVASPSNISVKLVGLNGQLVYAKELGQFAGQFKQTIDLESQAKGVYFLQIATDKDVINKKVIKN